MQKKIIALAVAALASGAAFAQTSIVIGGNVDMGYNQYDQEAKSTAGAKLKKDFTGFRTNDSANWSSSQITISVTEDLGNGLKAGFFNAIGLNPTTGGNGIDRGYGASSADNYAFGRNREAYAFLSGANWGQVAIGYKNTFENDLSGIGNAGSGNLSNVGRAFNSKTQLGDYTNESGLLTDTSRANLFSYNSPVWSGFQAFAQYGSVETKAELNGVETADNNNAKFYSFAGKYANGPLTVAALYSKQDQENFAITGLTAPAFEKDTYGVYANYDFKVAKVFFSYANREVDIKAPYTGAPITAKTNLEYEAFDLGVKVPFAGKFTFSANYGWGDIDGKNKLTSAKASADVDAYQVALTYDFSKRTSVTGYYADTSWDGNKALSGAKYDASILGFGLRHMF